MHPPIFITRLLVRLAAVIALAGFTACATKRPVTQPPAPAKNSVSARAARNLETFDAAWRIIAETHYDTNFNGVNWPTVRDELRPQAAAAPDTGALRLAIQAMLERLGDSHMGVIPGKVADAFDTKTSARKSAPSIKKKEALEKSAGATSSAPEPAGDSDADDHSGDVGLEIRFQDDQFLVTRVEPDGPAAKAGVRPGWILQSVGGTKLSEAIAEAAAQMKRHRLPLMAWSFARQQLAGAPGSKVKTEFLNGADESVTVELTRGPNPGEPVKLGNLPELFARTQHGRLRSAGGRAVGLIRFNIFLIPTARAFNRAVDELRDADGMVLDLRGNIGGLVGMIVGLSGHFLDDRVSLGMMKMRANELRIYANPRRVTDAGQPVEPFSGPVAILVDDISVSAAEVFAGGMQAIGRARIFGGITPGEALPAIFDRLPNGDVLLHAMADYTTPTGTRLEGRGVIPDEPTLLRRADLLAGRDAALEAALKWIDSRRENQKLTANDGK